MMPVFRLRVGRKRRVLILLSLAEVLAMAVWFSVSAVVPQLVRDWSLSPREAAWLTMSVQIGFVAGAFVSALLNLPDRFKAHHVIALSAMGAAFMNLIVMEVESFGWALFARLGSGLMLAGVYPPAMKLVATWTSSDRGAAIGVLIGALTLGSALPHLVNLVPASDLAGMPSWRDVLLITSLMAASGGPIVATGVREGPHLGDRASFNWRHVTTVLRSKPIRLANLGCLGHMWELYAVWVWVPILLIEVYQEAGWSIIAARLAGFGVIAAGAWVVSLPE